MTIFKIIAKYNTGWRDRSKECLFEGTQEEVDALIARLNAEQEVKAAQALEEYKESSRKHAALARKVLDIIHNGKLTEEEIAAVTELEYSFEKEQLEERIKWYEDDMTNLEKSPIHDRYVFSAVEVKTAAEFDPDAIYDYIMTLMAAEEDE